MKIKKNEVEKIMPFVKYEVMNRNLVNSYFWRLNFRYDGKFYKIRTKGNPYPLILDELKLMFSEQFGNSTEAFQKAKETMHNFFDACNRVQSKGQSPFYVLIEDFIPKANIDEGRNEQTAAGDDAVTDQIDPDTTE